MTWRQESVRRVKKVPGNGWSGDKKVSGESRKCREMDDLETSKCLASQEILVAGGEKERLSSKSEV